MNKQSHLQKCMFTLFLLMCGSLGTSGCTPLEPPPQVLVMIDFSISARHFHEDYKRYMNAVVTEMPANSRLVAGKIVESPEATFKPMLDVRFPDENFWTTNPEDVKEEKDILRKQISTAIDSVFQKTELSPYTNIISAVSLLSQTFPKPGRRVLVLFSDMLHSYTDFDLERDQITDEYTSRLLRLLKERGRVADLQGVDVFVAGAYAPTEERYRAVKKFWERFFQESGANLKSYGHSLMNFSLKN